MFEYRIKVHNKAKELSDSLLVYATYIEDETIRYSFLPPFSKGQVYYISPKRDSQEKVSLLRNIGGMYKCIMENLSSCYKKTV